MIELKWLWAESHLDSCRMSLLNSRLLTELGTFKMQKVDNNKMICHWKIYWNEAIRICNRNGIDLGISFSTVVWTSNVTAHHATPPQMTSHQRDSFSYQMPFWKHLFHTTRIWPIYLFFRFDKDITFSYKTFISSKNIQMTLLIKIFLHGVPYKQHSP